MNRPSLKIPCTLLLGVAVGCAIGRPPWWSGKAGAGSDRPAAQSGSDTGHGGGPAGSQGKAGTGKSVGKPTRERVEMLVARFRDRTVDGEAERMSMVLDIAELSAEEIGPVLEILLAAEDVNREVAESLVIRWGLLDPGAALDFAVGHDGIGNEWDVLSPIVQELAKVDLPAAKAALGRLGRGERASAGMAVVRLLMRKDARAALAYARELSDDDAETEALSSLAEKDPLAAAAELNPGKGVQLRAVEAIASALMTRNRAEFEEWMKTLRNPMQRAAALCIALSVKFQPDPGRAALEAADRLAKEPELLRGAGGLTEGIVHRWLRAEGPPAEVAAWVTGLPEGQARDSAIRETGRLWVGKDPMAASVWLASLPPSEGRDFGVFGLVQAISGETPADAFEWARTIEEPAMRAAALDKAVENWAGKDPDAAGKALETLPVKDRINLRGLLKTMKAQRGEEQ